jgi:hypothetical protein
MVHQRPLTHDDVESLPSLARPVVDPGRLGVYAAMGATVGAVPLPWVPDSLVRRVRGAVAHDVAVRHGVSLTNEAREVLSEPSGARGVLAQTTRFVGVRLAARFLGRFGPVRWVWPVRNAVQTYVLGRLFDRYLQHGRTDRAVRVDAGEARRVRKAIDDALLRTLSVEVPRREEPTVIDDQRDATTAFVDGLLGLVAGTPSRLGDRLDAAFDDRLAHGDG